MIYYLQACRVPKKQNLNFLFTPIKKGIGMCEKLILLVEDNPDDEILAVRVLTQEKVINHTMVVRDGQEALDYLFYEGAFSDRTLGNPQVILLDLKLPKVNGIDVLQKIRTSESTKLIPVIILTSSQHELDITASYNGGANAYLVKPVDKEQFANAIKQFLLYWVDLTKSLE